jgi:cytochrome c-type biogenesis protein CcmF
VNAAVGIAGVSLGLGGSLLGAVTVVSGLVRRQLQLVRMGRVYVVVVLAGAVLAFIAMERALITRDFSLAYVAEVGSKATPPLFNFAALWSALEGSILLWALVLSGYIAAVAWHFRKRLDDPLVGWALVTLFVISGFFFLLMFGPANPFKEVAGAIPTDGPGPNPLLQNHILMAFHPPMLYLGYVGFSVPFAFAIAALITGRVGEGWLLETRRWTLFAWGFLTIGIVLGAWWSYEVLGWGGVWAWDPVENAVFLPWLTGTAYIHSVLVQERRGMLRVWNLSLLCATFSLTILGTFLTRSGVLDSVHSFSESDIGAYLLTFFALSVGTAIALIGWRGDRLRSPGAIDSPVSREGAFLANNVLFAVFAFVVLLGTVFPLIVEAVQDRRISVGRPYFDRMATPIGLALLFLMAVAPVLPWRKASAELLRQRLFWPAWCGVAAVVIAVIAGADGLAPVLAFGLGGFAAGAALRQVVLATRRQGWRGLVGRANGGMIVHLGVVMIALALVSTQAYTRQYDVADVKPGQSVSVGGHTFTYERTTTVEDAVKREIKADIRVDGGRVYAPALQLYRASGETIGTPSVRSGWREDVYLTLERVPDADGTTTITVRLVPFVLWLWVGAGLMVVGTVLAAFPGSRRRRPVEPVSAPIRDDEPERVPEPAPVGAAWPERPGAEGAKSGVTAPRRGTSA